MESPDSITPIFNGDSPNGKSVPSGYSIANDGKKIFYYAINPTTKKITLAKTSSNASRYDAVEGELFSAKEFMASYNLDLSKL